MIKEEYLHLNMCVRQVKSVLRITIIYIYILGLYLRPVSSIIKRIIN